MTNNQNLGEIAECIACGSSNLRMALDLGEQAPANNLILRRDEEYETYPLGINACLDCGHGQLTYFVDPEKLFRVYNYVSSTSETMKNYMQLLANGVRALVGTDCAVLEIGSNDGLFLKSLRSAGIDRFMGVDPAVSIALKANLEGLPTVIGFWPDVMDEMGLKTEFDVVIGQNVFAHTANPYAALSAVKTVLKPGGYAMFQTSQADMIANGEFDTTYHEHCSFFCENSMAELARRAGLKLVYTHYVEMHGGSSLYVMVHSDETRNSEKIHQALVDSGLNYVLAHDRRVARLRECRLPRDWDQFLHEATLKSTYASDTAKRWAESGHRVVAVGAAAKAITFLRASNIVVDAMIDQSPLKIGSWIPGLDVQITDFENFAENDAYIIGAWNFAKEIAVKLIAAGANPEAPCMLYFPNGETTTLGRLVA